MRVGRRDVMGENLSSLGLGLGLGFSSLNDGIVTTILSFLPAKFISKLKLLNRRVRLLTSDDFFAAMQCRHAEAADSGFFAAYRYGADVRFVDRRAGIPGDAFELLRSTASILSSANGLVFYFDRTLRAPDRIAVYNPVRRASLAVPPPPDTELSLDRFVGVAGVVCSEAAPFDYKLVFAVHGPEWNSGVHCRVYDSRDGEWRVDAIVDGGRRSLRLDEPAVCGSTVFWASDCGVYMRGVDPYVVAVDVGAAAPCSRIVPLPAEAVAAGSPDEYDIRIARCGRRSGMLCLIQLRMAASLFAVWSLTTTTTNEKDAAAATAKWKKIGEVGFEEMKLRMKRRATVGRELQVGSFTLINGDILVFITVQCRRLYSYSLSSRQLKKLGRVQSPCSSLIPYANTLRRCGRDDNAVADK